MISLLVLIVIGMSLVGAIFMAVLMAWKYRSWTFATGWALLAVSPPLVIWWFAVRPGSSPPSSIAASLVLLWIILLFALLAGSFIFIHRRARKRPPLK